ncbi:hypothetical protein M434DRAFT_7659 [Hypoxylon sp. CO27-5]|nr:hypothetical protein M434DRAFT_7659 [Hypoxylon sp. CO27-5]
MAIEAINQILGLKDRPVHESPISFELSNISIRAAFVAPREDEMDASPRDVELHTTMSPRKISVMTVSADYPWIVGMGSLKKDFDLVLNSGHSQIYLQIAAGLEPMLHLLGTAGDMSSPRAYVPLFISECWIRSTLTKALGNEAEIYTRAAKTGIFTQRVDCTLRATGDVLINLKGTIANRYSEDYSKNQVLPIVADHGVIIFHETDEALSNLKTSDFAAIHVERDIVFAVWTIKNPSHLVGRSVLIVKLAGVAQVNSVQLSKIHTMEIHEKTVCISLLEIEIEFLATMNQEDMDLLRSITNVVTDLLWITGANILGSPKQADPNLTLTGGLSRTLMLEQPSLRFSIVDTGYTRYLEQDVRLICENLIRALVPLHEMDDKEFVHRDGLLYISRFGPDPTLNSLLRRKLGMGDRMRKNKLESAGLAQFSFDKVGHPDTIHFQKLHERPVELSAEFVDVTVKAVGLNAKDVYTLGGYIETRMGTTACEFSGVVRGVAWDVTHVKPGDRVMPIVLLSKRFVTPLIEAILVRRGVQAMAEDEFLQLIDLGIPQSDNDSDAQDIEGYPAAHILSGLESVGFRKLLAQGFDVNNLPMQDPHSRRLAESLALEKNALAAIQGREREVGQFAGAIEKAASASDFGEIMAKAKAGTTRDAILQIVRKQFSNLILVPAEQIDDLKYLAQYGVDSMLAAEFRTWFWATFEVDIPFLGLVSSQKSLDTLSGAVEAKLSESLDNSNHSA